MPRRDRVDGPEPPTDAELEFGLPASREWEEEFVGTLQERDMPQLAITNLRVRLAEASGWSG